MIVVIGIMSIFSSFAVPASINMYEKILLETTANKIKSALLLARQLSVDESKRYCVELVNNSTEFRLKEAVFKGNIILREKVNDRIKFEFTDKHHKITYNRNGETNYNKFIISNRGGKTIEIETLIGTGRVRLLKMY